MNRIFLILPILVTILGESRGSCPNIEAVANFDMDKILGHWYTVKKTGAVSPCLTLNFTRRSGRNREYDMVETSNSVGLANVFGLQHQNHLRGKLRVPDASFPAIMDLSLPLKTLKLTVFSTDYENYVAFLLCNKGFSFVHAPWVIISSRTPGLDQKQLESIYAKLMECNINPYEINTVKQHECGQHGGKGMGIVTKTASTILDTAKQTLGGIANIFNPKVRKPQKPEAKPQKQEEVKYDIDVRSSFTE